MSVYVRFKGTREWKKLITRVVIYNPNDYAIKGAQIRVDLSKYIKGNTIIRVVDANFNDITFGYEKSNGEVTNDYTQWDTGVIWIKIDMDAGEWKTLYILEDSTNLAVDGYSIFDFYDDFDDGVLAKGWVQVTGTWTESTGYIYVSTDYGKAPGNVIVNTNANFPSTIYIFEVGGVLGSSSTEAWDIGIVVNSQGTIASTIFDVVAIGAGQLININEWNGSVWGSAYYVAGTVNAGDYCYVKAWQDGTVLYGYTLDKTNGNSSSGSRSVSVSSGYVGLHISAGFTTSSKIDWIRVRKRLLRDPQVYVL